MAEGYPTVAEVRRLSALAEKYGLTTTSQWFQCGSPWPPPAVGQQGAK